MSRINVWSHVLRLWCCSAHDLGGLFSHSYYPYHTPSYYPPHIMGVPNGSYPPYGYPYMYGSAWPSGKHPRDGTLRNVAFANSGPSNSPKLLVIASKRMEHHHPCTHREVTEEHWRHLQRWLQKEAPALSTCRKCHLSFPVRHRYPLHPLN